MGANGNGKIVLAHGAGGRLSRELVEKVFVGAFANPILEQLEDAAELEAAEGRLAFTTDAFVVRPLFFPGGDIGKLAVCGTVNDLAMKGARPLALSSAVILEEGLDRALLERAVRSMSETARSAGVAVVCGDTKVVEKGAADRLFIVTSGVGVVKEGVRLSAGGVRAGDAILLSGAIADHGIAVLQARGEYAFEGEIASDCAPLWALVEILLHFCPEVRALRDPTRGGLASALNEISRASQVRLLIEEEKVPVRPAVRAACDLLGIDPFFVANEGKFIAFVPGDRAEEAVELLRRHPLGADAARVGEVVAGRAGVEVITKIGGRRPLRMLEGDQLPRIC